MALYYRSLLHLNLLSLLSLLSLLCTSVFALPQAGTRRFGFFIGGNEAAGKPRLRYAVSDARSMAKVMEEIGGIQAKDRQVLFNPDRQLVLEKLRAFKKVIRAHGKGRTELVFYYSGHSDERGLLLGSSLMEYLLLRKEILDLSTDVSVIILDSCASGSFTQLKGGVLAPPFLTDGLSRLKGYVALSSSSSNEGAQESDSIGASFFTYYLISALRGAGTSDSQVTLQQAYRYAYAQTLARTQYSVAGGQHASYNIQLTGAGDLVMTDLRSTPSLLRLDKGLTGRFLVLDASGLPVAEANKNSLSPMTLSLQPGRYALVINRGAKVARGNFNILAGKPTTIAEVDLKESDALPSQLRGGHRNEVDGSAPAWLSLGLPVAAAASGALLFLIPGSGGSGGAGIAIAASSIPLWLGFHRAPAPRNVESYFRRFFPIAMLVGGGITFAVGAGDAARDPLVVGAVIGLSSIPVYYILNRNSRQHDVSVGLLPGPSPVISLSYAYRF